jgi:putative membrane protein
MQRPSQLFSAEQRQRVNQVVAAAESKTAAEIVAAVASASGRYERSEDIIGLWFGLVALGLTWFLWPIELQERGSWSYTPLIWHLIALLLAVVVGFVVGAFIGNRIHWLRHWFTPRRQMHDAVFSSAKQAFCDRRVYRTARATGVLIFVSLYERIAAIVADQTVIERLGQPAVDEICDHLTKRLGHSDLTDAICSTIEVLGLRLSPLLPRAPDDANELDDSLVLLD